MFNTALSKSLSVLGAAAVITAAGFASAEPAAPKSAPATLAELKSLAHSVRKSDPARYRAMQYEISRLESKQSTASTIRITGYVVGAGLIAGASAMPKAMDCESKDLDSKGECKATAGKYMVYLAGAGVASIVTGWVVGNIVDPSREDVRRASKRRGSEAKARADFDVAGDPAAKSVRATFRVTF